LLALLVGEIINLILRATFFTQALGNGGVSFDVVVHFGLSTNYGRLWLARLVLLLLALLFHWTDNARRQQARSAPVTPAPGRASTRFGQLRQQARPTSGPAPSTFAIPAFMRAQARMSGAVASVSPTRGTGASLPRITTDLALDETSVPEPSNWQVIGWLILSGLIILTLALSNEILNLTSLPVSAGILI